jgi:hypothetical protein
MFLKFIEVKTKDTIAVNSDHVVAAFVATEGDLQGKTIINLINGMVAVEESLVTVLGQLAAV